MKPILIIHQHPEIESIQKEIEQRMVFIDKQMNDLMEKKESYFQDFWTKIHAYLETNSILKNPQKTRLKLQNGVIYEYGSEKSHPFQDFIANLFH